MNWTTVNDWLQTQGFENLIYRQVLELFIVVFITALVSYIAGKVFVKIERQFAKTNNLWDDTLLHAARAPITFAIWLIGLSCAAYTAQLQSGAEIFGAIPALQRVGVIFCLTWFIIRFISGGEKIVICPEKMKEPMDETTVSAMGKLLRASVIITSVLVVLQTLGYSLSVVLPFGGVVGMPEVFAVKIYWPTFLVD